MTMIYALGEISGAHFNPAVSFGFWLAKRLPFKEFLSFVVSQVLGGISASLFLKAIFPLHKTLGTTLPNLISPTGDFVFETILTFFLMFVIIHVAQGAKEKGMMAGVAIGGMVALEAIFAGPITGASMNPARSFCSRTLCQAIGNFYGYDLTAPFCRVSYGHWKLLFIERKGLL